MTDRRTNRRDWKYYHVVWAYSRLVNSAQNSSGSWFTSQSARGYTAFENRKCDVSFPQKHSWKERRVMYLLACDGCLTLSVPHFFRFWKMTLPKRSAPYWSNPPFIIFFDIRAFWCSVVSARMPECQKIKKCGLDQYGREHFEV